MKKIFLLISGLLLVSFCEDNPASSENDERILASYRSSEVEQLAKSIRADAELILIECKDVDLEGRALCWSYIYFAIAPDSLYYFHTEREKIMFDSSRSGALDGAGILSPDWIDSDQAIEIAEENGGQEIRAGESVFRLEGSLGKPVVPNAYNCWYIGYREEDSDALQVLFLIDAITGELKDKYIQ